MISLRSWGRQQAEDFLFEEAALLDEWKLDQWRALFAEECRYLVPAMTVDPNADPRATLFLIADDAYHLSERINRLKKKTAFAEQPRSRTLRMISNVTLRDWSEGQRPLRCAFITYRSTPETIDTFWGYHHYLMTDTAEGAKILEKRTVLTMSTLRPQGKLTIIL
jgi:p-cumate 2,3-dioxygenase subunit beta